MIKAGIIGSAGYTGGELIRILLRHPDCEIAFVHSRSQAGKSVHQIHSDLVGETNLKFTGNYKQTADVVFLCLGHGESSSFLKETHIPGHQRIIDLSQDFRLKPESGFVYGLPEIRRIDIIHAKRIANPGCFATAIQLALLPLAHSGDLHAPVHITGITGSTGAGQKYSPTTQFSWRYSNISLYKAFTHQHLSEIRQTLKIVTKQSAPPIYFLPHRGNFTRGIHISAYTQTDKTEQELKSIFYEFYRREPFIVISENMAHLKQVINTNKAVLHITKHDEMVLVVSVIDNLIKGAAGQAVQNMNIMFGLNETSGLQLKPQSF